MRDFTQPGLHGPVINHAPLVAQRRVPLRVLQPRGAAFAGQASCEYVIAASKVVSDIVALFDGTSAPRVAHVPLHDTTQTHGYVSTSQPTFPDTSTQRTQQDPLQRRRHYQLPPPRTSFSHRVPPPPTPSQPLFVSPRLHLHQQPGWQSDQMEPGRHPLQPPQGFHRPQRHPEYPQRPPHVNPFSPFEHSRRDPRRMPADEISRTGHAASSAAPGAAARSKSSQAMLIFLRFLGGTTRLPSLRQLINNESASAGALLARRATFPSQQQAIDSLIDPRTGHSDVAQQRSSHEHSAASQNSHGQYCTSSSSTAR